MFNLFKSDPVKKLDKQYHAKLKAAMESQRNGNIRMYAQLSAEAESIRASIEALKLESQSQ